MTSLNLSDDFSVPLEVDGRGTPIIIVGTMGSGKTVLSKIVASRLRSLGYYGLIISPVPDEHYLSKYRNPCADSFERPLYGLHRVKYGSFNWLPKRLGFLDWKGLSIADKGCILLDDLSRSKAYHDNVQEFIGMVNKLPAEMQGAFAWNKLHPDFYLERGLVPATLSSLQQNFRHIKQSCFLGDDKNLDFVKLVKESGVVVVEVPFFGLSADLNLMRAHCGMILKQFCSFDVLNSLGRFFVIIDEADKLCRTADDNVQYGSQVYSVDLIKKFNKAGCCTPIFLVQDLFNIPEELWTNCKIVLLGSGGFHPKFKFVNHKQRGVGSEKFWAVFYDNQFTGWFKSDKSWMRYTGFDLKKGF